MYYKSSVKPEPEEIIIVVDDEESYHFGWFDHSDGFWYLSDVGVGISDEEVKAWSYLELFGGFEEE